MKRNLAICGLAVMMCAIQSCRDDQYPLNPPTVITTEVTNISFKAATAGGTTTNDPGDSVIARGVCWNDAPLPTIEDNTTIDGSGSGIFVSTLSGLTPDTKYYVRAYAMNNTSVGYGQQVVFTTDVDFTGVTGTLTDIEGNSYPTIGIGKQIWMAGNLKTTKLTDNTTIPLVADDNEWAGLLTPGLCFYFNDEGSYKNTYGALYNWYAVGTGKLCPSGWHVPTNDEWISLEDYLIANGYNYDGSAYVNKIAKALSSSTGWNYYAEEGVPGNTDYPDKKNSTGFGALPGGVRDANQKLFGSMGNYGIWWTSTEETSGLAWDRGIANSTSSLNRLDVIKAHGFSVRCIKDN